MPVEANEEDEVAFRCAHEPAALWFAYLARRQRSNPLYLQRTLTYSTSSEQRGGEAHAAHAEPAPLARREGGVPRAAWGAPHARRAGS